MNAVNLIYYILTLVCCTLCVESSSGGRYNKLQFNTENRFKEEVCEFGICEHTDEYPTEDIVKLLQDYTKFDSFFGKVIEPFQEPKISNRFGDDHKGLCNSSIVEKKPTYCNDIHGNKRIIVNVENRTQLIAFEKCADPNKECFNSTLRSYQCTQKYTTIGLLTVKSLNEFEVARFKIPTTCVCTLKSSYRNYQSTLF